MRLSVQNPDPSQISALLSRCFFVALDLHRSGDRVPECRSLIEGRMGLRTDERPDFNSRAWIRECGHAF
jgi:hypothetical protein